MESERQNSMFARCDEMTPINGSCSLTRSTASWPRSERFHCPNRKEPIKTIRRPHSQYFWAKVEIPIVARVSTGRSVSSAEKNSVKRGTT